ncbi:MAG: metal-dependent hydrolase [Chloroflexota bacterium]|nr:metal-dependent hydrolase [Chloroflexota bacterium]
MTRPTHTFLGAAVAFPVAAMTHEPVLPLAIAGSVVAHIPDWDLRLHLPHRGPTHSLATAGLVAAVIGLAVDAVLPAWAVSAVLLVLAAYLSHLAADLVNPTPMALLWPYRRRARRRWLPAVREGTVSGRVVEVGVVLAVVVVAFRDIGEVGCL